MTLILRFPFALGAMAVAVTLASCATATRPLSLEEQLGFDKATGFDITGVPPGLRFHGPADYAYPGERAYLPPP